jgi:hypothetical protein
MHKKHECVTRGMQHIFGEQIEQFDFERLYRAYLESALPSARHVENPALRRLTLLANKPNKISLVARTEYIFLHLANLTAYLADQDVC